MGLIGPRIYLDSCLAIYLIEKHPQYVSIVRTALSTATANTICYSPLVELECMVGPLKAGNITLQAAYQRFFGSLTRLEIPASAYYAAARLRALHGFRTPDALHLATAQVNDCVQFWTNDERLSRAIPDLVRNILRSPTD